MKKIVSYMWCGLGVLALGACSDNDGPSNQDPMQTRKDIVLSRSETQLVNGQSEFAYELLAKTLTHSEPDSNVVIAPYTLSGALSMTVNAADPNNPGTGEIAKALGWDDADDVDAMNELYPRLTSELLKADNSVTLSIANSVWLADRFEYSPAFKNTVEKFYNAETFSFQYQNFQDLSRINQWGADVTHGMCPKVFDGNMNMLFLILSANYFNGNWSMPFDKTLTCKSTFTNSDSNVVEVDMMKKDKESVYYGSDFSAVKLPFGNGTFRMLLILPDEGVTTAQVTAGLSPDIIKDSFSKVMGTAKLEMPRFKAEFYNEKMKEVLCELGMPTAMNDNSLPLPNLAIENKVESSLNLDRIVQSAAVEVDETGVKASGSGAVEGMDTSTGPVKESIVFNRPFIFVIDEVSTGTVLFMGVINKL